MTDGSYSSPTLRSGLAEGRDKFISPEKRFTNEIDIYADKVSIISLNPKNLYGVIIKSESAADTQRSIYELLWSFL